jgi:hypothetical protein
VNGHQATKLSDDYAHLLSALSIIGKIQPENPTTLTVKWKNYSLLKLDQKMSLLYLKICHAIGEQFPETTLGAEFLH